MIELSHIDSLMKARDHATLEELARELACSVMTVRRHVRDLRNYPQLRRVPGGLVNLRFAGDFSGERHDGSRAIGNLLRSRLSSGTLAFADAGPWMGSALNSLRPMQGITLVSYDTRHALLLQDCPGLSLLLCGGEVDLQSGRVYGHEAERFLREFQADIALIHADALSPDGSLACQSVQERGLKRAMIEQAESVWLLLEAGTIDNRAPVIFGRLEEVDEVFTDGPWPAPLRDLCRDLDIPLVQAPTLSILPPSPHRSRSTT
jgi:DeoR family transcriptional regulator, glycerol-3-phosphate regulon repressor